MTVALRYAVRSDIGLIREGNEDSAYAGPHLLAIADGMGGHAAGEVASTVAISALIPLDAGTDGAGTDGDAMLRSLGDAVSRAAAQLGDITRDDPSTQGMGTTLTALLWAGVQVAVCHIGDSRGYLVRDGELRQITRDHTLVQSLVDDGKLTPEAAASHPQRSLVLRALQGGSPPEPDLELIQSRPGDRFLLCSDGLTDVVSADTLRKTMTERADLDEAVQQLVDLAIRSGGPDNITCVLADVVDADGAQAPQVIVAGAVADGQSPDGARPGRRADSPAARAHLLTRPGQRAATRRGRPAAAGGGPAGDSDEASGGAGGPDSDGTSGPGEADDDRGADQEDPAPGGPGRRWPVVSSALGILALLAVAGSMTVWHYSQNAWYVGADAGHVALFRGVNQPLAGLSLSTVYQRTGIPLSAVPGDARAVRATISATDLRQADQIVRRIRRDYRCHLAWAAVARWSAAQPKPARAVRQRHPARLGGRQRRVRLAGQQRHRRAPSPAAAPKQPPYPPRPAVPRYCPSPVWVSR